MYPRYKAEETEISSGDAPQDRGEIYLGNDYETEQENILTKKIFYEKKGKSIKKTIMIEGQVVEATKKMKITTRCFKLWFRKETSSQECLLTTKLC